MPPKTLSRKNAMATPPPMKTTPTTRPRSAAARVALTTSPLIPQTTAREDAPAVHGVAGNQVESADRNVRVGEIQEERAGRRVGVAQSQMSPIEDPAQRDAHDRACDGDDPLGHGAGSIPADLSDPAEEEECDAGNRDAVAPRRHAVPKLVGEHAGEEDSTGHDGYGPVLFRRGLVAAREEVRGQRVAEPREDEQPAVVNPDGDSGDASEPDRCSQGLARFPLRLRSHAWRHYRPAAQGRPTGPLAAPPRARPPWRTPRSGATPVHRGRSRTSTRCRAGPTRPPPTRGAPR